MKKKLMKLMVLTSMVALVCSGCGSNKKETKKADTGSKVTEAGYSDETSEIPEDEEETTTKAGTKSEIEDWVKYTGFSASYYLPMMHDYNKTQVHINDSSDIFIVMSYTIAEKYELEDILESNKGDLGYGMGYGSVGKRTYNIENKEYYTTDNGIEGIIYEGTLDRDGYEPYWFYSFCFNADEKSVDDISYQYIGFSSKQLLGKDIDDEELENIKKEIKERMNKSIDTIYFWS